MNVSDISRILASLKRPALAIIVAYPAGSMPARNAQADPEPSLVDGFRQAVTTSAAPAAIGPYSQAIIWRDLVFVSGQIAIDPQNGRLVAGGIREETQQVMKNLAAVLAAAGCGFEDVLQVHVFLSNLDDFAGMNEVYGRHFKVPPARATIQAGRLPRDARVEIALIAGRHPRR